MSNYTDNLKGFRKRKMAKKLNFVIDELAWRYKEIEDKISFVMGVQSRLSKGVGVSKDELMECEYILKETKYYG
jgi:hypothetical protein